MNLVKQVGGNVGRLRAYAGESGLIFTGECETGFLFSKIAEGRLALSWEELSKLVEKNKLGKTKEMEK